MIYIYGDSHGHHSFKNMILPNVNKHKNSITMYRIGRDNNIINFNPLETDDNSILCFVYGEIDCRCQIHKQKNLDRHEITIINELVSSFFTTIKNNVINYKKIIITAVIPPTKKEEYENLHGPITHEFPFLGSDEDRVRHTIMLNNVLKKKCDEYDYIFFEPYEYYTRPDGTLKYELSDYVVHIGDNNVILDKFTELYNSIIQ